jgi:GDP-mannose 6-dehydrogenase
MNISIFGLGYVGVVSLGCLAQNGHRVIGVDVNAPKVELINKGESPIVERGIGEIINRQKNEGRISATTDGIEAVKFTDVSFICVGTPSGPNGHTDTAAVLKVTEEIGKGIMEKESFHVVVIRSTVPPGTNDKVAQIIETSSGKRKNRDFAVVSNPEFLREGTSVKDYYSPPFTLIATESSLATEKMKEVYRDIKAPFIVSDIGVAEMIKYVNNAFHALKITFANEIGNICKKLNIDSHKLMEVFCMDSKLNLSPYYLRPGFAYGGSCLPKDLKALKTIARDKYVDCPVIENIERSNDLQKQIVLEQILAFDKKEIGFLGLSFKAGTDDLRNSPIVDIIEQLIGKGFNVRIYDRNVHLSQLIGANKEYILRKIPYISQFITDSPQEIIEKSEVLVVVNKENDFKELINNAPDKKHIYDLVNLNYDKGRKKQRYIGISW